jgi:heme ABC exporter ATP-binding subunit CcmA
MASAVCFREAVALAGRFPLLAGVTLDVDEGEIVHLRGPNGAGKTSLLRLCCGLVALKSGSGIVLGHDLSVDRNSLRRQVGLLAHATFLYDELSVEENLRFALRAAGGDVARVDGAMERLGLSGRLRTLPVAHLSAGQRRRVALAVLVGRWPRLWLLDEPHAGLDQGARDLLDELILEAKAGGATVLLSSHEHARAELVADRVVQLAGGQVVEPAHVA